MTASVALRPYQARAVAAARQAYREGARAPLVVCPTGGGKTRIGAEVAVSATAKGGQVLWLAHRSELLKQARDRLLAEGVEHLAIVAPWATPDPGAPVQIASTQTLLARRKAGQSLPTARVVVLDEAHHYAANDWREVAGAFPGAVLLGLTATPERGDQRPMGDIFDRLIPVASVRELIGLGHLVPCDVIGPAAYRKALSENPVAAYQRHSPGERAFVFAQTVAEAGELADAFAAAGVPAGVITSETSERERERLLGDFRAGRLLALCNVFVLTEGVDVPEASVCIVARGCEATGTYLQMVGRVLRPAPWVGKTRAKILDLRGVTWLHGKPDLDRVFSLEGVAISRGSGGAKKPSLAHCKACDAIVDAWREEGEARTCPSCGAPAPKPKRAPISREQLQAIHDAKPVDQRMRELAKLREIGRARGYKPGWASVQYKARFGQWPPREEAT